MIGNSSRIVLRLFSFTNFWLIYKLVLPESISAYLQNVLWVSVVVNLTQMLSCLSSIFLSTNGSSSAFRANKTLSSVILFNSFSFSSVHSSALELWAHAFNIPIASSLILHWIFFATYSTEYLSQTSFGHISINSQSILTVSMATESPWKDLSIGTSHVSRRSVTAEILGRSTGNHHGTVY